MLPFELLEQPLAAGLGGPQAGALVCGAVSGRAHGARVWALFHGPLQPHSGHAALLYSAAAGLWHVRGRHSDQRPDLLAAGVFRCGAGRAAGGFRGGGGRAGVRFHPPAAAGVPLPDSSRISGLSGPIMPATCTRTCLPAASSRWGSRCCFRVWRRCWPTRPGCRTPTSCCTIRCWWRGCFRCFSRPSTCCPLGSSMAATLCTGCWGRAGQRGYRWCCSWPLSSTPGWGCFRCTSDTDTWLYGAVPYALYLWAVLRRAVPTARRALLLAAAVWLGQVA